VQWDTSQPEWLEGRGEKLYLIWMNDDATSRAIGRFVRSDSTEANLGVLELWLRRWGRMVACYTDKASLFRTAPKVARDQKELPGDEREPWPPTQIGRALEELNIVWIPAHSPQAKGRVERFFETAQDRLVKGMRLAGVKTIEEANAYLEKEYLVWWEKTGTVVPANADDAHRRLEKSQDLAAILSRVESRQVKNDYTIQFAGKTYGIERADMSAGLRGATGRVEKRRDGTLAIRFRDQYLRHQLCERPQPAGEYRKPPAASGKKKAVKAERKSRWMKGPRKAFIQAMRKLSVRFVVTSFTPGPWFPLPVGPVPGYRTRRKEHTFPIVRDEFRPAIPRSACSPALPPSRPGELHPEALTDPDLSLSTHPARATH